MAWKGFLPWFKSNHSDEVVRLEETLRVVIDLCEDISPAAVHEMITNQSCMHI
jgi:hypothetical protein